MATRSAPIRRRRGFRSAPWQGRIMNAEQTNKIPAPTANCVRRLDILTKPFGSSRFRPPSGIEVQRAVAAFSFRCASQAPDFITATAVPRLPSSSAVMRGESHCSGHNNYPGGRSAFERGALCIRGPHDYRVEFAARIGWMRECPQPEGRAPTNFGRGQHAAIGETLLDAILTKVRPLRKR